VKYRTKERSKDEAKRNERETSYNIITLARLLLIIDSRDIH